MAVKPITNPHPKRDENINRANQVSNKGMVSRKADRLSSSVVPGKDFTKDYAIRLKDIDGAMMSHLKNVMNINQN